MRNSCLPLSIAATVFFLLVAPVSGHAQTAAPAGGSELARVEVRFSQLDEQMRAMRGKMEELEYENRRLRELLDRFQQDVNVRFTDLESAAANTAPAATAEQVATTPAETTPAPASNPEDDQTLKAPSAGSTTAKSEFANSRDHYNHAFRLLNQTQYDQAGKSFESFVKAYPKDPLVGNAFYWAGETYYVRQDYAKSADYFRQGFEALPSGPKAGDNLLKLAMSLSALKRAQEACIVLKQVVAKFGANSVSLKKKAELERGRVGCK